MMGIGWSVAVFVWLMGMWQTYRVNQAIIEIEYRETMNNDRTFFVMVCLYSMLTIVLWPVVQLFSMQHAFSHSGEGEEE